MNTGIMNNANRILTSLLTLIAISSLALGQQPSRSGGAPTGLTFTFGLVDYPGADAKQSAHAINDKGRIVGSYVAPDSNRNGFLLQGSKFQQIVYPGASSTLPQGISRAGAVVGSYSLDGGTTSHGFLLKGQNYTTVDAPGATKTVLTAVNASGALIGLNSSDQSHVHGFMLQGGTFTAIDFPSSPSTLPYGMNAAGEIVGIYEQPDGSFHGFTLQNGTYTTVDYPGANVTNLIDINDSGQMVGSYSTDNGASYHGFVFSGGVFTSFDAPYGGATRTFGDGINNHNQIVGSYIDSAGYDLGFVASFQ